MGDVKDAVSYLLPKIITLSYHDLEYVSQYIYIFFIFKIKIQNTYSRNPELEDEFQEPK